MVELILVTSNDLPDVRSNILDTLEEASLGTSAQAEIVKMHNSALGILSSVPMLCREECQYRQVCPLADERVDPVGERCPIEVDLLRSMFVSYCRELEINPDTDKIQAGLVKDLCVIELQAFRASKLMGFRNLVERSVDAVNPNTGEVYYKDSISVIAGWSERLLTQKLRVLEALAATPLVRLKALGSIDKTSILDKLSEMRDKLATQMMPYSNAKIDEYEIEAYIDDGEE